MEEVPAVVGLAITHLILYGAGAPAAYIYRRRIDGMLLHALTFLWVPAALLVFSYLGIASGGRSSLLLSVGLLLVRIGMVNNFLNLARTRDGARKIARRKALAGARRFFERELSGRSPRLSDAWFPYVLAFGLGPSADRWARSFGAAGAGGSVTAAHSASGSSSSSSGSSGGWTGGGGNFGGAGASASWAAAAGGLAGGVSAPSSGGGGGGGGGGGSSGGGGGGGW
jgi:uncharacterized membrane protein YgcG